MEGKHASVKRILSTISKLFNQLNNRVEIQRVQHLMRGTSMWFWSVSLADRLSSQFLIFFVGQKKLYSLTDQRPDYFFCSLSWNTYLSSLFWKIISKLDKKNQESGRPQNMRNWPDNWLVKRPTKTKWTALRFCHWQLYNCFIVANQRGWRGGTLQSKEVWVQRIAWHPDLVNNSTAK